MNVISLKLENFQNYENETVQFENGVSLFYGANGSGKSTILRGIFAGLFQTSMTTQSAMDFNIGNLIKSGEDRCHIELEFEANGSLYTVEWSIIRRKDGSGQTDSCVLHTTETTVTGITDVSNHIKELLGMDAQSFVNSVYIQQMEIMELISADSSTRKEIFDGLLGLRNVDSYINRAKLAKRGIKQERKDKQSKRDELRRQMGDSSVEDIESELDSKREKLERITNKISELESELESKKDTYSSLQSLETERKNITSDISDLQDKKQERESRLENIKEELTELNTEIEELIEEKSELDSTLDKLIEESDCVEESAGEITIESVENRLNNLRKSISTKREATTELNSRVNQAKSRKESISEEITETRESIETKEDRVNDLKSDQKETQSLLDVTRSEKQDRFGDLEGTIEKVNRLDIIETRLLDDLTSSQKSSSLERQQTLSSIQSILQSEKADITSDLKSANSELERLQDRIGELDREIDELNNTDTISLNASFWNPLVKADSIESQKTSDNPEQIRKEIRDKLNSGKTPSELKTETKKLYASLIKQQGERESELQTEKENKQSRVEKLRTERKELEDAKKKVQKASDIIEEAETEVSEINTLEKQEQRYEEQLEDIDEEINTLESELEVDTQELNEAEKEILEIKETLSTAQSEHKKEKVVLQKMESNESELQHIKDTISELDNINTKISSKQSSLDTKEETAAEIEQTIDSVAEEISTAKKEKAEVESEIGRIPDDIEIKIEALDEKVSTYSSKKDSFSSEITKLEVEKENLEERSNRAQGIEKDISSYTSYLQTIDEFIVTYKEVKKSYRKEAIKYINVYTNEIFDKLYTNSQYSRVEITMDYDIKLHTQSGEIISPEFSSGGESAIVNIAIRAGIYRVINEKTRSEGGSGLPPFILDEPTTFLDSDHISKLESLISALREWDVEQVFVVSHEDVLLDTADNLFKVELDSNNNSKVTKKSIE